MVKEQITPPSANAAAKKRVMLVVLSMTLCIVSAAHAAGGPLAIDHRLNKDESGIWSRNYQLSVYYSLIGIGIGGALIEGTETRAGLTFWRAVESGSLALVTAEVLKRTFTRPRPSQGNDPDRWFQGNDFQSFPSNEVALASAVTTPFILQYASEYPATWALAAIPAYVAVARMKSQAHWQTDVIGAIALGVASGYLASQPERPLMLRAMGNGVFIGLRYRW